MQCLRHEDMTSSVNVSPYCSFPKHDCITNMWTLILHVHMHGFTSHLHLLSINVQYKAPLYT